MHNEEHDIIYTKWLNGELTDTELDQLKASGDLAIMEKIMNETGSWSLPKPKSSFEQFKSEKLNNSKKNTKVISLRRWISVAASVIVLIGASYFSYMRFFDITEYHTASGETKNITLPDGSEVILNGNSSLSYNNYNWSANREVEMDGQAYFKVEKKGPFEVDFGNGTVQVVGTEFDVMNHNNASVVKCFEGEVKVVFSEKEYRLTHHMGVRINEKGNEEEFGFEGNKSEWLNEHTKFTDTPLNEVLSALSLRYGLSFDVNTGLKSDEKFSGQFPNNDVDLALRLVFEPMGVTFSKKEDTVTLK